MALDGDGQLVAEVTNDRLAAVIGRSQSLGDFHLVFPKSSSKVLYSYLVSYTPSLDKVQETVVQALRAFPSKNKNSPAQHYIGLTGKAMPEGLPESRANLIVYQVSCTSNTVVSVKLLYIFRAFYGCPLFTAILYSFFSKSDL